MTSLIGKIGSYFSMARTYASRKLAKGRAILGQKAEVLREIDEKYEDLQYQGRKIERLARQGTEKLEHLIRIHALSPEKALRLHDISEKYGVEGVARAISSYLNNNPIETDFDISGTSPIYNVFTAFIAANSYDLSLALQGEKTAEDVNRDIYSKLTTQFNYFKNGKQWKDRRDNKKHDYNVIETLASQIVQPEKIEVLIHWVNQLKSIDFVEFYKNIALGNFDFVQNMGEFIPPVLAFDKDDKFQTASSLESNMDIVFDNLFSVGESSYFQVGAVYAANLLEQRISKGRFRRSQSVKELYVDKFIRSFKSKNRPRAKVESGDDIENREYAIVTMLVASDKENKLANVSAHMKKMREARDIDTIVDSYKEIAAIGDSVNGVLKGPVNYSGGARKSADRGYGRLYVVEGDKRNPTPRFAAFNDWLVDTVFGEGVLGKAVDLFKYSEGRYFGRSDVTEKTRIRTYPDFYLAAAGLGAVAGGVLGLGIRNWLDGKSIGYGIRELGMHLAQSAKGAIRLDFNPAKRAIADILFYDPKEPDYTVALDSDIKQKFVDYLMKKD